MVIGGHLIGYGGERRRLNAMGWEDGVREVVRRSDSYTYITLVQDTAVSRCINAMCDALEAYLLYRGKVWREWKIFQ